MKGYTCEGLNPHFYPQASEAQQQRLCADSAAATTASKHLPRCKGCDGTQQFQQRLLRALVAEAHTPGVGVGALPEGFNAAGSGIKSTRSTEGRSVISTIAVAEPSGAAYSCLQSRSHGSADLSERPF